jgi:hemerythrin
MRLFKWSNRHSIYIPEFDVEHQNVFRLAEEVYQAVLAGIPAAQTEASLRDLLAYAESHFSHEERLMRSLHCPSYPWHKQQHGSLRKKAGQLASRIRRGDRETALALLQFMSKRLKDHIALADRMMAAHLRNYARARVA